MDAFVWWVIGLCNFHFSEKEKEISSWSDHHHRVITKRLYNHSTLISEFTWKKYFSIAFLNDAQCVSSKMEMMTLPASRDDAALAASYIVHMQSSYRGFYE